jgi:glycosyltransferase involved in cell wall biosynthesis
MKLLTITVPSYNSENWLPKCLDSMIVNRNDLEVIIINDGSGDKTRSIGKDYEKKYPHIFRLISQENAGHGGAIMTGVKNATGKYFKVVDSDDRLDTAALNTFLDTIKQNKEEVDMYFTNYIHEQALTNRFIKHEYKQNIRPNTVLTWDKVKRFTLWNPVMIHALTHRTRILKDLNLQLPTKAYFDDMVFTYIPLFQAEKVYYADLDLYYYFVGRPGQTINIVNSAKHYKDMFVNMEILFRTKPFKKVLKLPNGLKFLCKKMLSDCFTVMCLYAYTNSKAEKHCVTELKNIFAKLKSIDKQAYKYSKNSGALWMTHLLPLGLRIKLFAYGYKVTQKKLGY